jgi:diacylglycerol kinase family enzyme
MNVKNIDSEYTILSICNGAYYGGGYNIAPKSKLTDGLLDIYYAEKMPKIKMIPLILKLKKGKHEGKRRIHKYRTRHVELELDEEVTFNVDGEKLVDKKFVIDVLPEKITIYNDKELVEEILKD